MRSVECDLEKALHMFSWSIVLHSGVRVLPHHVIDGLHDVQHLLKSEEQQGKNIEDAEIVDRHYKKKNHVKVWLWWVSRGAKDAQSYIRLLL